MNASPNVRWLAKGQNGELAAWAGDGTGVVTLFDEQRAGFGEAGEDKRGPAALVRFNIPLRLEAWIPISELDHIQEAA